MEIKLNQTDIQPGSFAFVQASPSLLEKILSLNVVKKLNIQELTIESGVDYETLSSFTTDLQ